jgi:hypothetical protein
MTEQENGEFRETLCVAGGLALMVFGAGLLMTHPLIRRTVLSTVTPLLPGLQERATSEVSRVLPDIERYLKLRSM